MENQFTIEQIASKCKVSKQSIYSLIKKNKAFIDENSTRKQRKIYYNQAAMNFFISYYHPQETTETREIPSSAVSIQMAEGQAENSPLECSQAEEPHKSQQTPLQSQINALQAEIDALRKQLDASEKERKDLFQQNGALLLLLQQEKQEKMLLLPAPKKTLSERVKGLFHKQG